MKNVVLLNGRYISESKAVVSVNNRSFRYGDGCFETIKVINGKISLATFHLDRLFASLQCLQFQLPSFFTAEFVLKSIHELVNKNEHHHSGRVRLCVFSGDGGLYDTATRHFNYLIQSWPLDFVSNMLNENGLVIGTYKDGYKTTDKFSNIKSNNFLLYVMAALHAKKHQWNDALVCNHRGDLADASVANLFIIQDKMVITPPLTDGPIQGTVRSYLLQNLSKIGYQVKQASISPEQLNMADECFLTNAIYGLKWVQQHENATFKNRHVYTIYEALIKPLWDD